MGYKEQYGEKYETCLKRAKSLANENGYVLNPDAERLEKVVGLMTRNFVEFGKYYCPCKQSHPLDPDKDTLCPCEPWKEEVSELGHCFCKLFYEK